MADYTPVFAPSKTVTLTASTALVGGDILEVSGSGTVQKCATAGSQKYIGVAGNDTVINGRVTVYSRGYIHESVADGAITAGDQLQTSATAGRQVKTLPAQDVGGAFGQGAVNAA